MHLRYDPNDDVIRDERGLCLTAPFGDREAVEMYRQLYREVRDWCDRWDGARRREFRIRKPVRPAVAFQSKPPEFYSIPWKRFVIELSRPPRPDRIMRGPNRASAARAFDQKMAMLNAMRVGNMNAKPVTQIALAPKPPLGPRPKLSRWHSGQHFIEALCKRGYHVLGAGAYSTVLAKPGSNRVVKVCRKADTWLDYVVWAAKAGHAGRMAPNVFSYRRFNVGRPSEFYVAVMEKLEATIATVQYSKPRDYHAYACLREFIERRQDRDGLEAEKVWPGAIAFGIAFRVEFTRGLDLHGNNWMVRKDGSLVCTDPLCDESKTTAPERMRSRDLAALRAA